MSSKYDILILIYLFGVLEFVSGLGFLIFLKMKHLFIVSCVACTVLFALKFVV